MPNLSATNSFTVIVGAPSLDFIPNFRINPGQLLSFTNMAVDNDPARHLSFGLDAAPSGATITSDAGFFSWRPLVSQAGTSNYVQVRVTDDSAIPLSGVRGFGVSVNPLQPAVMQLFSQTNGALVLRITGTVGPDYILQTSADLIHWLDLQTNSPVSTPFELLLSPGAKAFYRVRLGP